MNFKPFNKVTRGGARRFANKGFTDVIYKPCFVSGKKIFVPDQPSLNIHSLEYPDEIPEPVKL
ncbi:MAG: hypothetical protein ACQERU_08355 [Bacteroidota bacterium]